LIKLLAYRNLKNNKKYSSKEETVKMPNRFEPLSAKEDSKDMSDVKLSDKDNIVKSKVVKRMKEKKMKSASKSEAKFKTNNSISSDNLRNDWKRYFRKKKERDKISI